MTLPGWAEGAVVGRQLWTPNLLTLTVRAEVEPFKSGQFLNLGLEHNGELLRRSYSLASAPGADLEFYLARVEAGVLTPLLFELPMGGKLWVERKPQGFFTLDYVPEAKILWCFASGTGLGPFISMLRGDEVWRRFETIVLVQGVREAAHLSYTEELQQRSRTHGNRLVVLPVVSREEAPGLLHGRVTHALETGALEQRAGFRLEPDTSHVLLCGNPDMVRDMTDLLKAKGLRRHRVRTPGHISTEKYW